jgi:GT2 family glycosyltransferase
MWKKANPKNTPAQPTLPVRGYFDGVVGRRAIGWLADETMTDHAIVEILLDGRVVGEGKANLFRQDLLDAGIGVGAHGFDIPLPEFLFDGQARVLIARSKRHGLYLHGNPKTINKPLASPKSALDAGAIQAIEARLAQIEGAIQEQGALLQAIHQAITSSGSNFAPAPVPKAVDRGRFFEQCRDAPRPRGDVVVFSIIDWDFRVQRPQHLSRRLADRGYRVLYVSVQIDTHQRQWESRFEVRASPAPGVFEVRLRVAGERPSVYAGFTNSQQLKDAIVSMNELVTALDVHRPQAILQFPSWLPIARSMAGVTIVYDCLDHMEGFSNVSKEVAALEKQLVEDADIVVTSSAYLHDRVQRVRPAALIRNGCEYEYFSKRPSEIAIASRGPVIGYYGAIADWFDVDLVLGLARKHPEWRFELIGSTTGCDTSALAALPNVTFHGEKPYVELTKYLYGFDVCIIPFKASELIKATNPVKLYEYLAAGKPVVCTDISEARTAPSDLVHVASSFDTFEAAIIDSLAETDASLAERRKAWAANNSWDARASSYDDVLQASSPRVSVVVLTYNGITFTQACLHSLEQFSDYPNLEIICVDNDSGDGTKEFLSAWGAERPQHKVILNNSNLGFAGGNNVGIAAARGEIVILLNNDTYVTAGWVRDLIRPLMQDKTIGLAGPITNMIGGVQKVSINYSDMTEMAQRAREFTMLRKSDLYDADALAFFCVAMRRDLIEELGVLDTAFGVGFFEDDDYCQRVLKAGYRLVCVDGVFMHHHLSASFNEIEGSARGELFRRNRAIYEARWGKWIPHTYRDAPGFGE